MTSEAIFATRTTTRLLDALRDAANEPAWQHMDQRFRPVIAGLAKRLGLSQSDADEVAQQTLAEFVHAYRDGRYDRGKGRLSSWILGIAHHQTLRVLRTQARGRTEPTPLTEVADESSLRSIWTDERDRSILSRAMSLIRDESGIDDRTLTAFELVGLRGVPAAQVAEQCKMTIEQVYVAKSRVAKRLKELVEEMTRAFEEDV
jgi:RNA polymerase sigma-70 factor (ECF subfamily)